MSSSEVSLLQMPEIPMKHILEYLEFPSILILRKVCHDLRNFIDVTKPASHLTEICIDVLPKYIGFTLYVPRSLFSIRIDYKKNGEGCLVKCRGVRKFLFQCYKNEKHKEIMLEDEDFVTVFCKDFDIVLRHQKTELDDFKITFDSSNSTVMERILENVNKSLKFMNKPPQVKSLYMGVNNHNEILIILPYIDPKPLIKIHINQPLGKDNVVLNLDEIGQLKQWKQAKELKIERFEIPHPAQNLTHFSRINLHLPKISTEELILLKEMFLFSSTSNEMEIYCYGNLSQFIRQEQIESFGQPFVDRYQHRYWFFKIPDTNQFLKITFKYGSIYFTRIEQSGVHRNAIILN